MEKQSYNIVYFKDKDDLEKAKLRLIELAGLQSESQTNLNGLDPHQHYERGREYKKIAEYNAEMDFINKILGKIGSPFSYMVQGEVEDCYIN